MSTPENTFITSVHKHLPDKLYRMKNHNQYNGGIPDCWYSGDKADLWVEYKYRAIPARATTDMSPDLSALQIEWLLNRHAEGRDVAVITGCADGGVLTRVGELWAMTAGQFRERMKNRRELAAMIASKCMLFTT